MKKILVTGGKGRFARVLKKVTENKYKFIFTDKKNLNILNSQSIVKCLKKYKVNYVLHLAALSRPMKIHITNIEKSIRTNIIGTCNVALACLKFKVKLIYFSTNYVYDGKKGSYKEEDPVLPWNNYGWSKLGGESAVQMLKNSLILRVCMTEKPFIHKYAYADVKSNFIFHEDLIKLLVKILDKKGIYNIGGPAQNIYDFAKKYNKRVKKKYSNDNFPKKLHMNLNKLKNIIN